MTRVRVQAWCCLIALAACGTAAPKGSPGSISGTVTQGPTCPVERPGLDCAPRPVAGTAQLRAHGKVLTSAPLDAAGRYSLIAPAGSYSVAIDVGATAFPVCPATPVEIVAGRTVTQNVSCDTGIR